jgi:hypothetical protein
MHIIIISLPDLFHTVQHTQNELNEVPEKKNSVYQSENILTISIN